MTHHHVSIAAPQVVFIVANLVIAAGYASVPVLVLPHLPLQLHVRLLGAGLFAGCMGSHLWMAFTHHNANGWWALEHVGQAVCTWGFIIAFGTALRRANQRRAQRGGDPASAGR